MYQAHWMLTCQNSLIYTPLKQQTTNKRNSTISNEEATPPKTEEPIAVKTEDFDALLSKYLRVTKEQRLAYIQEEHLVFMTLLKIRDQTVWAFKTSEEIGKNVLAYDPIPGKQKGCVSLEEATGGKAWAL